MSADDTINNAHTAGLVQYFQNRPPYPGVFVYKGVKYRANSTANDPEELAAAIERDEPKRFRAHQEPRNAELAK